MKNTIVLTALLAVVALFSAPAFGGSPEPLTVSPGAVDRFTGVEARCPTFSWQAVPGAVAYEVVVYELPPQVELAAWSLDEAVEVVFVELPAGVTAWTPSLESGLARGADHVWFVRGVFGDGSADGTPWSRARFFRVVGAVAQTDASSVNPGARVSGTDADADSDAGGARSEKTTAEPGRSAMAKRVGEQNTKDVGTAMAAIRGEMPDATGETYGVVGTSNSIDGAGLGAVNTAGGPDLVLDGAQDTETDLDVYQWGIDRASAGVESFGFANSIGGSLDVWVQGNVDAYALFGDGTGVTNVDAETLDGIDSSAFSPLAHLHDDRYYTEGELNASGGGGSVHWDNLGAVPAGFADGVDHDTTYTAGTGLDLTATEFKIQGSGYGGLVVVAKSGGDFSSVQAAIDSISGASPSVQYLVWVAPGQYIGRVTLKPYVHLQGAGEGATQITSSSSSTSWPPDQPTLTLSSYSSVRDLSVSMTGTATWNTAMLAGSGTDNSSVSDVTVTASGAGTLNYPTLLYGAGTEVTLENVTSMSYGAATNNYGLYVWQGADITLRGGLYTGQGGTDATGIYNSATDTSLTADGVFALGENASGDNIGLHNSNGAEALLIGGKMTGRGGNTSVGIGSDGVDSVLQAFSAVARAEDASSKDYGFQNSGGASANLNGGEFSGAGGVDSIGISNSDTGSVLEANSVKSIGMSGSTYCYGIENRSAASAILSGGAFVARGCTYARGILNRDSGSIVEAAGVHAIGDSGSSMSNGLYSTFSSTTKIRGGLLVGRGGDNARAIENWSSAILDASGITAVGEDGTSTNHSLYLTSGTCRLGASQLIGDAYRDPVGTLTCFHVYDENFTSYSCP